MKAKIRVTFDMELDGEKKKDNVHTDVHFSLPDYPDTPCPESIKALVIPEIGILCRAIEAASAQIFSEEESQ